MPRAAGVLLTPSCIAEPARALDSARWRTARQSPLCKRPSPSCSLQAARVSAPEHNDARPRQPLPLPPRPLSRSPLPPSSPRRPIPRAPEAKSGSTPPRARLRMHAAGVANAHAHIASVHVAGACLRIPPLPPPPAARPRRTRPPPRSESHRLRSRCIGCAAAMLPPHSPPSLAPSCLAPPCSPSAAAPCPWT